MSAPVSRCADRGDLRTENGAGSVTALATVLATLILLVAALALGTAAVAAARAGAAADLAALAAADAFRGLVLADPCTLAEQTAARHGARLAECTLQRGGVVLVRTEVEAGQPWTATGVARAGPPRLQ